MPALEVASPALEAASRALVEELLVLEVALLVLEEVTVREGVRVVPDTSIQSLPQRHQS